MRIKVVMFAALAQRAGVAELSLDLSAAATVDDAVAALAGMYPVIAEMRGKLATAVNLSYVGAAEVLREGDELALIPPVSGG